MILMLFVKMQKATTNFDVSNDDDGLTREWVCLTGWLAG